MNVNVDQILSQVLPWDCRFTIEGRVYHVPPPALGTLKMLERFEKEAATLDDEDAAKIVDALFADPKPNLPSRTLPLVQLVVTATLAYTTDYLSKKSQAVALQRPEFQGFRSLGMRHRRLPGLPRNRRPV